MPLNATSLPYEAAEDVEGAHAALGVNLDALSPLALRRLSYRPRCPPVLCGALSLQPCSEALPAAGDDDKIAALFPRMHRKPLLRVDFHSGDDALEVGRPVRIGVVLSGGPAAGGHNVVAGVFDYLATRNRASTVLGFLGGPSGIIERRYMEVDEQALFRHRNQGGFHMLASGRTKIETPEQFAAVLTACTELALDGLVMVGGDDSNTNACLLAEYLAEQQCPTRVVGVPKTIDGDLRNQYIEASFGFDSAAKVYAELVANLGFDAVSAQKVYHVCRLMGRSASHITLEVALQTHPNLAIISEEVAAKQQTLRAIVSDVADLVCERAAANKHYGVIILPEGLVEFMPDVKALIAELNEVLAQRNAGDGAGAAGAADDASMIREIGALLSKDAAALLDSLPPSFARQLCMDRDPHGNVQVSKIESERLIAEMVDAELRARKRDGAYSGKFSTVTHFFGYEGRCGLPSNFDSNYCYTLGQVAAALVEQGCSCYMARASGLTRAPELWAVGGVPLTAMMNIERRKGNDVPVIEKSVVQMRSAAFADFSAKRSAWRLSDDFRCVGPTQFDGPMADAVTYTLLAGDHA